MFVLGGQVVRMLAPKSALAVAACEATSHREWLSLVLILGCMNQLFDLSPLRSPGLPRA